MPRDCTSRQIKTHIRRRCRSRSRLASLIFTPTRFDRERFNSAGKPSATILARGSFIGLADDYRCLRRIHLDSRTRLATHVVHLDGDIRILSWLFNRTANPLAISHEPSSNISALHRPDRHLRGDCKSFVPITEPTACRQLDRSVRRTCQLHVVEGFNWTRLVSFVQRIAIAQLVN